MIKKHLLLSLLFAMHGISAMCCLPTKGDICEGVNCSNPYRVLHAKASAAARAISPLKKRKKIEGLILQELFHYKTPDAKQVVLNYWLECVLDHESLGEKEILQAEILCERGADVNAAPGALTNMHPPHGGRQKTLLMHYVGNDCLEAVDFLLNHGADPCRYDYFGESALHHAVETYGKERNVKKMCAIIDLFLAKGVPIDHPTDNPDPNQISTHYCKGKTVLWKALEGISLEIVKKLLKWGAQPNYLHPKTKARPLDYALNMLSAHPEIAETLYCYGADSDLLLEKEREEFEHVANDYLVDEDYRYLQQHSSGQECKEEQSFNRLYRQTVKESVGEFLLEPLADIAIEYRGTAVVKQSRLDEAISCCVED